MLIDEIRSGKTSVFYVSYHDCRSALDDAARFELSDIAPMFVAEINARDERDGLPRWWTPRDAFALIPPFPRTWCEYSMPGFGRIGCLFESFRQVCGSDVENKFPYSDMRAISKAGYYPENLGKISIALETEDYILAKDSFFVRASLFFLANDQPESIIAYSPSAMFTVAPTGEPLDMPDSGTYAPEISDSMRAVIEDIRGQSSMFFEYCFNLLACKNVEIVERPIDEKLQKARIRRGKKPLLSMYTLKINMPKSGAFKKEQRDPNNETVMKRFHAVRGHFAHYTEEKPLFGKYAGRFFVSAHTRGSKDLGEIRKDYKGVAK